MSTNFMRENRYIRAIGGKVIDQPLDTCHASKAGFNRRAVGAVSTKFFYRATRIGKPFFLFSGRANFASQRKKGMQTLIINQFI